MKICSRANTAVFTNLPFLGNPVEYYQYFQNKMKGNFTVETATKSSCLFNQSSLKMSCDILL